MRVLIVGAGIAGSTLAYWLQRAGHEPTLLELAPTLRRGGYLIDFWGTGFDVAERMGVVPRLLEEGYKLTEARDVASDGHKIASLDPQRFVAGTSGRYVSILRADLATAIYDALEEDVETIFGDTVAQLTEGSGASTSNSSMAANANSTSSSVRTDCTPESVNWFSVRSRDSSVTSASQSRHSTSQATARETNTLPSCMAKSDHRRSVSRCGTTGRCSC